LRAGATEASPSSGSSVAPLMDRFLSSDLGRNVRSDAPQEEGRQERLGNIPVVLAHHVSAARAGDDTHRSSHARLSSPKPSIGTTLY